MGNNSSVDKNEFKGCINLISKLEASQDPPSDLIIDPSIIPFKISSESSKDIKCLLIDKMNIACLAHNVKLVEYIANQYDCLLRYNDGPIESPNYYEVKGKNKLLYAISYIYHPLECEYRCIFNEHIKYINNEKLWNVVTIDAQKIFFTYYIRRYFRSDMLKPNLTESVVNEYIKETKSVDFALEYHDQLNAENKMWMINLTDKDLYKLIDTPELKFKDLFRYSKLLRDEFRINIFDRCAHYLIGKIYFKNYMKIYGLFNEWDLPSDASPYVIIKTIIELEIFNPMVIEAVHREFLLPKEENIKELLPKWISIYKDDKFVEKIFIKILRSESNNELIHSILAKNENPLSKIDLSHIDKVEMLKGLNYLIQDYYQIVYTNDVFKANNNCHDDKLIRSLWKLYHRIQILHIDNKLVKYLDGLLTAVQEYKNIDDNVIEDEPCQCNSDEICKRCCTICCERVKRVSTNCGHVFCYKCIKDTEQCYICNSDITSIKKVYLD